MNDLFAITIFPGAENLTGLLIRIALNLAVTAIVVRVVYFKRYHHRDYIFTYFLLNVVTFSIAFLLSSVQLNLGFGLGLFAVFGILRYRTEAIQVRNLTYLFVVIGVALVNALGDEEVSLVELLIINGLIVATVWLLEAASFSGREESHRIRYDRLDLLGPATAAEVLNDLRTRTRLPITRYEIGDVDLLRDTAEVAVFYPPSGQQKLKT